MAGRLLVRCPTLWKSQPLLTSRVCEQMKDAQIVCFQYMDFGLDWIGVDCHSITHHKNTYKHKLESTIMLIS